MSFEFFHKGRRQAATKSSQRGQAMVEYIIVTAFAVMVLLANDGKVLVDLINAFKAYYNAFAFAISFSTMLTP